MRLGSRFFDLSIRGKLAWIGILASGSALLTASVAFVVYDFVFFRQAIVRGLERDAAIIGANSTAALEFQDPRAAESTLSALKTEPHVLGAAIYDEAGRLFALYARDAALFVPPTALPKDPAGHRFERGRVMLSQPIVSERRRIGSVFIEADLRERWQRLREFGGIVALVSLAALGVAVVISSRYEAAIARPVQQLAAAARSVSSQKDYSVRVPPGGRDEMGQLIETFNEMLARIQQRDAEVQDARDGLERRVEERTHELQRELEERRRAEDEILRLNGEAEVRLLEMTALNREIEAFSYSVSHDLRAPLRHVNGFVDLLKARASEALDEKSRHYLTLIADGAKQMGRLIDDLLSFSRMSRTGMAETTVPLDALVKEVLPEVQRDAAGRAIEWSIAPLPEVKGDRAMLRIVLTNLLSNAVKYTRKQEHAKIEVGAQPGESGEAVLFFKDNGVGFDMRYVDKLFGVFQRLHRAEEFEGTGIGLATVRRILHRHGGRIWAVSAPNAGATFYISLPLAERRQA
jgi:signal transduction histidine kinase